MEDGGLELRAWVESAERLIAGRPCRVVRRVVALAETASTQDAALSMCDGKSGVLVLAGRQSAGRGRLGRSWTQRAGLGVAATLTYRCEQEKQGLVSLAAGVAAARTVGTVLGSESLIGIRWPNDVLERERGRKLAGVLIEARDGVLLIGIGINVLQQEGDWPEELRGRAVSVAELGSAATRGAVIVALVDALEESLAALESETGRAGLLARWRLLDMLCGKHAEFTSGQQRFFGMVESIEPNLEIVLAMDDGRRIHLPAATTSLVHD